MGSLEVDANLLAINGGSITLTKDWAKYILKHMGWVRRHTSSKANIIVKILRKLKKIFCLM